MTLAELSIRRPVLATMLNLGLVVAGLFSYFALGVDLYPNVDVPTVTVTTVSPGSSAQEVESDITRPVEDAVNAISGLDTLESTSVSEDRAAV